MTDIKMKEQQETFTPGPWHCSRVIRGRDKYYRQIRADFGSAQVLGKIAEVHACHSGVAGTKKGRAEDEANARLIAAAPDMYKLLEKVREGNAYDVTSLAIEAGDMLAKIKKG